MMKLVNISKSGNTYLIKAVIPFKILGIEIASNIREFSLTEEHNEWFDSKTCKKASRSKVAKLNKWLRDHQKFVEKN